LNIFVKYDSKGRILSVTRVAKMPEGVKSPYAVDSEEGVEVLGIEPLGQFADMEPLDIHNNFAVDVEKKTLVKQRPEKIRPSKKSG
jgi:hypothetical protein